MDPPASRTPTHAASPNALHDLIRLRPGLLFGLAGVALKEILNTPKWAWQRRQILSRGEQAVGYVGWIGHKNLGDEAVLEAIRQSLTVDESLVPFLAVEGESMLTRFGLGGPGMFRSVLFGGGTLIHPYYLPVGQLARKSGIPLYTVGTGVGSPGFFTPEHPSLAGWEPILKDCELLSVRGPLSCELLQNLGLKHTEVIGDPALGLAPDLPPACRTRQRLVINLVHETTPASDGAEYAMLRIVAKIANEFADRGGELVGVALGGRDRRALQRFAREHRVARLRIEDHRTSALGLFETLVGSVALIGIRLHSAVLASCVGVPSILFSYRDKCRDFMSSMDLADFAVEISRERGPQLVAERFEELQSRTDLGPAIYRKAVFWKNRQQAFYARLAQSIAAIPRR